MVTRDFMAGARDIEGLSVDAAVKAMGGVESTYEQSARIFLKTSHDTVGKMDLYIESGDIPSFAVEIHGIKGSLNNIGAFTLGEMALKLEAAARNGEAGYCVENYAAFKEGLCPLLERLSLISQKDGAQIKQSGSLTALRDILLRAREAAEAYDSLEAFRIISRAVGFSYGSQFDEAILRAASALELFDCESALDDIEKLENQCQQVKD